MENNLDDFFRNKLNNDSSSDGWDEPSEEVWQNAQPQFPRHRKSILFSWFWIPIFIMGLGLVSSFGYIYNINKSKKTLSEEIIKLENKLSKQLSTKAVLETEFSAYKNQCELGQINTQNTIKYLKIKQANTIITLNNLQETLRKRQQENSILVNENLSIINENNRLRQQIADLQLDQATQAMATITSNDVFNIPKKPLRNLESKLLLVSAQTTEDFNLPKIVKPKKEWKKYEIGINRVPLNLYLESINDFQRSVVKENTISYFAGSANAYGLSFGYAPFENFYIHTGIKYANFNMNNRDITGIEYDESTEYINGNGNLANDLILNSQAPNTNATTQTISIEIPSGTDLETGDIILSTLDNYLSVDYIQFPLGVAFYRGKKRLQWEFQGGVSWNLLYFQNFQSTFEFRTNNSNISIEGFDFIDGGQTSNQYLSGYFGIGANYQLSKKWHARFGLIFEETGGRTNINSASRAIQIESNFNLSLNYRF